MPIRRFCSACSSASQHLRFMGVLQRIGIAYIGAALLTHADDAASSRSSIVVAHAPPRLLARDDARPGSWARATIGYFLLDQPDQTLAAWSTALILGTNHIWASSKTWDPEGPLSTIPAIATALLGDLRRASGSREKRRPLVERIAGLFGAGCARHDRRLAVELGLSDQQESLDQLATSSSPPASPASFSATCIWLIDVHRRARHGRSRSSIYGVNPLVAFVGSGLMARTASIRCSRSTWTAKRSRCIRRRSRFFEPYFPPSSRRCCGALLRRALARHPVAAVPAKHHSAVVNVL